MNIFQSAIDNWPEDEARQESAHLAELIAEGEESAYILQQVQKLPAHWARVFSGESDAAELWARFVREFNNGMPAEFHLKA